MIDYLMVTTSNSHHIDQHLPVSYSKGRFHSLLDNRRTTSGTRSGTRSGTYQQLSWQRPSQAHGGQR
jgi:hypothetical protein